MKRTISMMLIVSMCGALMTGCGGPDDGNAVGTEVVEGTEAVNGGESEIELESGNIELTVWAEESNFDVLNQMFESFKEEYAGQATFEITLEEKADSQTRKT